MTGLQSLGNHKLRRPQSMPQLPARADQVASRAMQISDDQVGGVARRATAPESPSRWRGSLFWAATRPRSIGTPYFAIEVTSAAAANVRYLRMIDNCSVVPDSSWNATGGVYCKSMMIIAIAVVGGTGGSALGGLAQRLGQGTGCWPKQAMPGCRVRSKKRAQVW